jgi:Ca2+-binding RTX toxin-like protein
VNYDHAPSAVFVNLTANSFTGGDGTDTVSGVDHVDGTEHDDELTGDGDVNDLSGLGGDDLIDGRGEDDQLTGGLGVDTVTYGSMPGPVSASLAANGSAGAQGADGLFGVENLTGSPDGDALTGDGGVNHIDGGAGPDDLFLRDSNADTADCGAGDGAVDDVEADLPDGTDLLSNCDADNVVLGTPPVAPPPDAGQGGAQGQPGKAMPKCPKGKKLKKVKGKRRCVKKRKK